MKKNDAQAALRDLADPEIAGHSQRFFKTGEGEYAEGDQFLGIRVPNIRKVARRFKQLSLAEIEKLLHSDFHEERLCGLIMMANRAKKAKPEEQKKLYDLYLLNADYINNWDLVDVSAEHVVGRYLFSNDRAILYELAQSDELWERRIAIMSTYHFIKNNDFEDTLAIAELLLDDEHDLIHKASGWMLREVGNRDMDAEERFLKKHVLQMPRTMLRYAIEKFPEEKRQQYLNMG